MNRFSFLLEFLAMNIISVRPLFTFWNVSLLLQAHFLCLGKVLIEWRWIAQELEVPGCSWFWNLCASPRVVSGGDTWREPLDFWPRATRWWKFNSVSSSAVLRGWQFVTCAWNQIQSFNSIPKSRCSVGFGWSQRLENTAVIFEKTHFFILDEISPESLTAFSTVGNIPCWMWLLK